MTGRQEYDRTKDRQRILDEYMIDPHTSLALLNYPHPSSALLIFSHPHSALQTVSSSPFSSSHCIRTHIQFFSLYPHPSLAWFTIVSSPFQLFSLCILIPIQLLSRYHRPSSLYHHPSLALLTESSSPWPSTLFTISSSPSMQLFSLYPHPPCFSLYPHPSSARFTIASSHFQLFTVSSSPFSSCHGILTLSIFISFQCTVSSIPTGLFSVYPYK
jgi:hypothetical protein